LEPRYFYPTDNQWAPESLVPTLCKTRLNVLPQFKRLLEFGISADFPRIIDTAAEKMGFES
jgi:hypothetical protein